MPAWLLPLLLKYVLPAVIAWLQKEGYIDAAEALAAKGAVAIVNDVKSLKIYDEYPGGEGNRPPDA